MSPLSPLPGRPIWRRAAITVSTLALGTLVLVAAVVMREPRPLIEFRSFYQVTALDFSPDGKLLASGSTDRKLKIWDAETGQIVQAIAADAASLAYSPDGSQIATGGDDGTVKLWDAHTGRALRTLDGHQSSINAVLFSPDGRVLASAGFDGTVRLWDPASGVLSKTLEGHSGSTRAIAFSPSGTMLASGDGEGTIRIWDVADATLRLSIRVPHEANQSGTSIFSISFAADGQLLASASADNAVRLWNAYSGNLEQSIDVGSVSYLVLFSPNMPLLATAGRKIRLWDLSGRARLRETLSAYTMAFSPDGRRFAGADNSAYTIKVWDVDQR